MAKRKRPSRRTQVAWYGDDILEIVRKYGDEALFSMGEHVLGKAQANAPVGKTGNLRKSGYISTGSRTTYVRRAYWRKEKKPPTNAVTVGFSAPHAHLIEGGRRKSGRFGPRRRGRNPKRALKIGDRFVARSRFKRLRSRHFIMPAVEQTRESMTQVLAKKLQSRLEQFLGVRWP